MGEQIEVPYEQQLEEMKRLLVLLMATMGRSHVEFTWVQQMQVPMDAEIMTWRQRLDDILVLEVYGTPPLDGVVEAEIVEEPRAVEVGNA
jgi:hypothetical protein